MSASAARRETRLGVPRGGGAVVERAEVAVTVDQRHAQRERLREAHEGVVDRGVAVGVQLSHHLADDAGALDVPAVGPKAHVGHLVQDAPLHRLQPVAGVGKRAGVDHRVGVLEERPLHLGRDVDVFDALVVGGGGVGAGCGHGDQASGERASEIGGGRPQVCETGPDVPQPTRGPAAARSLTRVVPELIAALDGRSDWFAPATQRRRVRGRRARRPQPRRPRRTRPLPRRRRREEGHRAHGLPVDDGRRADDLCSPATDPGVHGIVGYRVRIPGTDDVVEPAAAAGRPTDSTRAPGSAPSRSSSASRCGRPCFVVSRREYAGSGFTEATLRGAELRVADDLAERVRARRRPRGAASGRSRVSYAPELDTAATDAAGSPTMGRRPGDGGCRGPLALAALGRRHRGGRHGRPRHGRRATHRHLLLTRRR